VHCVAGEKEIEIEIGSVGEEGGIMQENKEETREYYLEGTNGTRKKAEMGVIRPRADRPQFLESCGGERRARGRSTRALASSTKAA